MRISDWSSDVCSSDLAGRGELQLGVLIETMRREGFELSIARPRVLYRNDPTTGQRLEPIEEVQVDVDEEHTGAVVEKMGLRKAELIDMRPSGGGKPRVTFLAPAPGLIGYHREFLPPHRKSVVSGKSVSGRAALGWHRFTTH